MRGKLIMRGKQGFIFLCIGFSFFAYSTSYHPVAIHLVQKLNIPFEKISSSGTPLLTFHTNGIPYDAEQRELEKVVASVFNNQEDCPVDQSLSLLYKDKKVKGVVDVRAIAHRGFVDVHAIAQAFKSATIDIKHIGIDDEIFPIPAPPLPPSSHASSIKNLSWSYNGSPQLIDNIKSHITSGYITKYDDRSSLLTTKFMATPKEDHILIQGWNNVQTLKRVNVGPSMIIGFGSKQPGLKITGSPGVVAYLDELRWKINFCY